MTVYNEVICYFLITYIYLTATQMWLLGRYLPLMIGAEIPSDDEHWKSFTLLLQIMQYLFAPKLSEDDLAILEEMIR